MATKVQLEVRIVELEAVVAERKERISALSASLSKLEADAVERQLFDALVHEPSAR